MKHFLFGFISVFWLMSILSKHLMAQSAIYSGLQLNDAAYINIEIDDGKISRIKSIDKSESESKIYIAPGLIDTQINGYRSISFSETGLTVEKVKKITEALWKEGVTTFFPTLITNNPDIVIQNLKTLSKAIEDPVIDHCIPGFFLEGPYISSLDGFRGAHNADWVREPDWNEFFGFYEAANRRIIQVGVAPEIVGSIDFIRQCAILGIHVSLAHHNGTTSQINEAVANGARISTHLGNGCANLIHRHNNPIWPQLANNLLTPSIIADGHHLTKEELTVFYQVKGPDHLMLVSDVTQLAGMPPGSYEWDGKTVVMTEDGMLQFPEQQVLAGASFPIRYGVMNMVRLVNLPLENAFNMATRTPAKVYQLNDRGELRTGMSADLVLFTIENGQMNILQTVVQGKVVFKK